MNVVPTVEQTVLQVDIDLEGVQVKGMPQFVCSNHQELVSDEESASDFALMCAQILENLKEQLGYVWLGQIRLEIISDPKLKKFESATYYSVQLFEGTSATDFKEYVTELAQVGLLFEEFKKYSFTVGFLIQQEAYN